MNIYQAVGLRLKQLCADKHTNVNALAENAKIPPSTVYSLMNGKSRNPGVVTIAAICRGQGITLSDFFDCWMFK